MLDGNAFGCSTDSGYGTPDRRAVATSQPERIGKERERSWRHQGSGAWVLEDPLTNKGTASPRRNAPSRVCVACRRPWWRRWRSGRAGRDQATVSMLRDRPAHEPARAAGHQRDAVRPAGADHVQEMLSILYTPTVGLACQRFSEMIVVRGLFIAYLTATASGRSCVPAAAGGRCHRCHRRATGAGLVTRASAAWASRLGSCRCTRCWAASTCVHLAGAPGRRHRQRRAPRRPDVPRLAAPPDRGRPLRRLR